MSDLPERYRRWFEYEKDAHARVLQSLDAVPDQHRSDARFRKAADLLAHVIAARWLWLHRLGVAEKGPDELFPQDVELAALGPELDRVHAAWTAYLDRLDDVELARQLEYTSYEGERYRNRVEDILTQLFGHSWYHRGQIAALVRALGSEPAVTDFVFRTRELLPDLSF